MPCIKIFLGPFAPTLSSWKESQANMSLSSMGHPKSLMTTLRVGHEKLFLQYSIMCGTTERKKQSWKHRTEYRLAWIMYMRFGMRAEGIKSSRTIFAKARNDRWIPWEVYEAAGLSFSLFITFSYSFRLSPHGISLLQWKECCQSDFWERSWCIRQWNWLCPEIPGVPLEDATMEEEEVKKHDPCFELDGAKVWKSRYFSDHFKDLRNPGSQDRLKLYANVSQYAIKQDSHRDIIESDMSDGLEGPMIKIDVPIVTLLKCEGRLFVCIREMTLLSIRNMLILSRWIYYLNLWHLSPFRCSTSFLPQSMTVHISSMIGSGHSQEVQATGYKVVWSRWLIQISQWKTSENHVICLKAHFCNHLEHCYLDK